MESLSAALQPHKELVGSVASVVTIGQFLSGSFICKDIYKKGNTDGISSNPFIGGIVMGVLFLQYGIMLQDQAMFQVNMFAIILNSIYLLFYYSYAKVKGDVLKSISIGVAVASVFLAYARMENPELIEYRFGLITTVLMLLLLGSPLLEVGEVISKQDASAIPFPIVLSGSVVTFLWLLYGIILLNDFMIFQNVVGLILCVIQLALCFMYPGKKEKTN